MIMKQLIGLIAAALITAFFSGVFVREAAAAPMYVVVLPPGGAQ